MADSTTHFDVIAVNEVAKEVVINGLFDVASQTLTYGRREAACSGRTWTFFGGLVTLPAGTAILAATAGKWAELVSDGTNWVIMAEA